MCFNTGNHHLSLCQSWGDILDNALGHSGLEASRHIDNYINRKEKTNLVICTSTSSFAFKWKSFNHSFL